MRKRDVELGVYLGTNCPQIEMEGLTEKNEKCWLVIQEMFCVLFNQFQAKKPNLLKCG